MVNGEDTVKCEVFEYRSSECAYQCSTTSANSEDGTNGAVLPPAAPGSRPLLHHVVMLENYVSDVGVVHNSDEFLLDW